MSGALHRHKPCPSWAARAQEVEGREYDDLSGDDTNEESDRKQPADAERLQ
jgi:hypothetical protein